MGIGFGIGMVLVGLDIPYVDDYSLGILLIVLGIIGIVLTLMVWNRASRSTVVEERRVDDPGLP